MSQKDIIQKIKNKKGNNIDVLLKEYVNNGHLLVYLLMHTDDLSYEKKKIIYNFCLNEWNVNIFKLLSVNVFENDYNKSLLIDCLLESKKENLAYIVMTKIVEPKKCINKEKIKQILLCINTKSIICDFFNYFEEEILDYKNYIDLIQIRNNISDKVLKQIYEKSFKNVEEYKKIVDELNNEEKKIYIKEFMKFKSNNPFITNDILINNYYDNEKDFDNLLKIIGNSGNAKIIYEVLIREKLNDKEVFLLEKKLEETYNIEYISYYYFYKKKNKFNCLYENSLLFLSFVLMNKQLFTNKEILEDITNIIKEENVSYKDEIESKVKTFYIRRRKIK